jgi:hypothetical protein
MRKSFLFNALMSLLLLASHSIAVADDTFYDEWSVGSGKFKIGAAWLYWQVNQDNLIAGTFIRENAEGVRFSKPIGINQQWNSGYRVNIGYEFCDCWELELYYTNIPVRTHSRHHRLDDNFDDSIVLSDQFCFSDFIDPAPLNSLRNKWRSELSWLDLDISREVCFGECLTVRPHIGFRTLWNNRTYHIHGTFVDPSTAVTVPGAVDPFFAAHLKDDLTGYGAEGGLWGNYELGCGLSIVGHFGGSILYTKHRTHQAAANANYFVSTTPIVGAVASDSDDVSSDLVEAYLDPIYSKHSHFFGIPTMDYFIGVQYQSTFCDFILTTTLGWEQHIFFDINRLSRNHGNLSAQGLTLNFEAAF